jgi:hypothetical protein
MQIESGGTALISRWYQKKIKYFVPRVSSERFNRYMDLKVSSYGTITSEELVSSIDIKYFTLNTMNSTVKENSRIYLEEITKIQENQIGWMTKMATIKRVRVKNVLSRINDGEFSDCDDFVMASESKGEKAIALSRELEKRQKAEAALLKIETKPVSPIEKIEVDEIAVP